MLFCLWFSFFVLSGKQMPGASIQSSFTSSSTPFWLCVAALGLSLVTLCYVVLSHGLLNKASKELNSNDYEPSTPALFGGFLSSSASVSGAYSGYRVPMGFIAAGCPSMGTPPHVPENPPSGGGTPPPEKPPRG